MPRLTFAMMLVLPAGAAFAQHDHGAPAPAGQGAAAAQGSPAEQRPAARQWAGQSGEWTRQPILVAAMTRGGDRFAALLKPRGIQAATVTVFAPDGPEARLRVDYPVGPEGARIESAAPQAGNYHWVVARQEIAGEAPEVRVASTAWYFSNPGPAPTAMLQRSRHELEIIPDPLPREHGAYHESEKWRFLVRWQGKPLPGQTLMLETEFGSRTTAQTDERGYATVLFPRDFKAASGDQAGGHGRRRARFVVATERMDAGWRYLTAFNHSYSPDPDRERSLAWGAAFGLAGMIGALPLLRRRAARTDFGGDHA